MHTSQLGLLIDDIDYLDHDQGQGTDVKNSADPRTGLSPAADLEIYTGVQSYVSSIERHYKELRDGRHNMGKLGSKENELW